MKKTPNISVDLVPYSQIGNNAALDLDQIIYDLESQIEFLTSQSDSIDYLVSISSGVLCGMLDVLWVGEFSLDRGRDIAADKVEDFVKKLPDWPDVKVMILQKPLSIWKSCSPFRVMETHLILVAVFSTIWEILHTIQQLLA